MESDKAPTEAQTRLMYLVDGLRRHFGERLRDELGEHPYTDVRRSELRLLLLVPHSGATMTALADLAGVTKQSLGEFVERLRSAEYVTVVADPEDRRARRVQLTERGEAAQRRILRASRAVEDAWRATVGASRYDSMKETLAVLAANAGASSRVKPGAE